MVSQARLGAKSTHAGRRRAEGSTIVTPPGPRDAVLVEEARADESTGALRRPSKLEVRRQARLHRVGSFGKRAKVPAFASGASAQGEPARASGAPQGVVRRDRAPGIVRSVGAREENRLQASVRRILLVLTRELARNEPVGL